MKPFREPPKGRFKRADVRELVNAAHGARFALHGALLCAKEDGEDEALEIFGESLSELTEALRKFYGEGKLPPICSGCSPLTIEKDGFNERA